MSYFGRKLVPDLFSDSNRPFSSSKDSHFQNEATSAKPFAIGLTWRQRLETTRKWPIT